MNSQHYYTREDGREASGIHRINTILMLLTKTPPLLQGNPFQNLLITRLRITNDLGRSNKSPREGCMSTYTASMFPRVTMTKFVAINNTNKTKSKRAAQSRRHSVRQPTASTFLKTSIRVVVSGTRRVPFKKTSNFSGEALPYVRSLSSFFGYVNTF